MKAIRSALDTVRRNRRDMARIGAQTAVATAATYGVMTWLGASFVSWAVISALFSIGVTADASWHIAAGRVAGALLGVGFGLGASDLLGLPPLVGVVLATTLASIVAAGWPSLQYAGVTAAIIALDPSPEVGSAIERAGSILIGTLIGAAASFTIWPVFARQRATFALERALDDCRRLLELMAQAVDTDERQERDSLHASFLGNLEQARARLASTRFRPSLPNGRPLRDAVRATESLWHAIVILDRAVSAERQRLDDRVMARIRPVIDNVQREASVFAAQLLGLMSDPGAERANKEGLCHSVSAARDEAAAVRKLTNGDDRQERAVHAVIFALDETERRLLQLKVALEPSPEGEAATAG